MIYAEQMAPAVVPLPLSLVALSVLAGIVMMALFRVASRPEAIRRAKRRVQAHLLELRLFGDDPALIFKAQANLLKANARYLAVMLLPIAACAVPFVLAFSWMETTYGQTPAPIGSETIVTAKLRGPMDGAAAPPRLVAPAGLRIESGPVRVPRLSEALWRVRVVGAVSGPLKLENDPPDSLEIERRAARLSAIGLTMPWEVWFIAISMVAALAVKSRLGVVF